MRYRKLSDSGDYTFGNGQADFYRDVPAAVGQAVQTRLRLWLGEWFLDIEAGTLYMQSVLGKHSLEAADRTIQARVLGTQGLTAFENYVSAIDPDDRAMTARFDIDTIYGPTAVQVANYANY